MEAPQKWPYRQMNAVLTGTGAAPIIVRERNTTGKSEVCEGGPMRLIRAKNYDDMSLKAANIIAAQVSLNPKSVLGLATGSTPIGTYRHLVEWYQKGELDFGKAVSINLDEYCGLSGDHPQSYRRFMRENLFDHINIPADRSFLPDGTQTDSALECAQYDRIIEEHNGIDLQLLGIGRNAHIGFNEPDSCFACGTHQVTLTESTIAANTRFFENEAQVPRQAYSMGMQAIMRAKRVLLIASGADKAEAIRNSFFGPVTPQVPASILQLHRDVIVIADEAALADCPAEA